MDTKLTLKLNRDIIEAAKEYAAESKSSLSKIVENYLRLLTDKKKTDDEIEISPFIKSFSTGINIPADLDYRKEYRDYLEEKYK